MIVIGVILCAITAAALVFTAPRNSHIRLWSSLFGSKSNNKNSSDPEKTDKKRSGYGASPGEPIPVPEPLKELTPENLSQRDARPWRPFRWPYFQTMSIFKLDINHWLDMDKWYKRYIDDKIDVYARTGRDYIDWIPGESDECTEELLWIVVDYLTARYPALFVRTDIGVDNLVTKEKMDLRKPFKEHPLYYISRLAKEDFYLVLKRPDGKHYLVAAAVPAPGGFFSVKDKLGEHLDTIHEPVPKYQSKLKPSMERWFSKMTPTEMVERASWFICWDHELTCNGVFAMPHGQTVPADTEYSKFNVRVCRQTLRRLPKSQAIIFTNHPVFYSIDEMKDEPGVPSIIRKIVQEGPDDILKYKAFETFEAHLMPYLDQLVQRQVDMGLIPKDYEPKTDKNYPFAQWYDKTKPEEPQGWPHP